VSTCCGTICLGLRPASTFAGIAAQLEGFSGADVDILCREATMRTVRLLIERLEREHNLDSTPVEKPLVSMDDVKASIKVTRPTSQVVPLKKYSDWEKSFGSTMSAGEVPEPAAAAE
jgi:katanin p60 ATPase-containing subunit A1